MANTEKVGILTHIDDDGNKTELYPVVKTDSTLTTTGTPADAAATGEAIAEATNIAKGRNRARVFATTAAMESWLKDAANKGVCIVGDNLYIVQVDVPDWWVSEVLEAADAETGYYYKVSQLETQKVDLTNYLSQSDVVDNLSSTAKNLPLSANQGRSINENLVTKNLKTYTNVSQLGLTLDNTLDDIFDALSSGSQLVTIIQQGKNLGGSLPNSNTSELIVTKGNYERAIAVLTQYANGVHRINHCYGGEWKGWETLATQTELDKKAPKTFSVKHGALYTDANGNITASSDVSASELGFLNGVTSSIQTQLNGKAGLGTQPYFGGVTVGGSSSQAYIYSEGENINFRYKNSAGTVVYSNMRDICRGSVSGTTLNIVLG